MPQFLIRFNTHLGLIKLSAIFHTTVLLFDLLCSQQNMPHFVLSWHIMAQIKSDGLAIIIQEDGDQHVNKSTNK